MLKDESLMRVGKQVVSQLSLMSVGRLSQTSGPLTENARRPNCVLVRRTYSVKSFVVAPGCLGLLLSSGIQFKATFEGLLSVSLSTSPASHVFIISDSCLFQTFSSTSCWSLHDNPIFYRINCS